MKLFKVDSIQNTILILWFHFIIEIKYQFLIQGSILSNDNNYYKTIIAYWILGFKIKIDRDKFTLSVMIFVNYLTN